MNEQEQKIAASLLDQASKSKNSNHIATYIAAYEALTRSSLNRINAQKLSITE